MTRTPRPGVHVPETRPEVGEDVGHDSGVPFARPRPRRRFVTVTIPAPVRALIGEPGWSGLAAFREDRRDVVEELLCAGLGGDDA
jgi:hypothetical protein